MLVILITICHTILIIWVRRSWYLIHGFSCNWYMFLYSHHLSVWYCVVIIRRNTVLVTLGSLNVKHCVSLHKVSHNAVIISSLELFQQLFFKFDENLKMVLNQFISVSQGVKNEIDKWIIGFEYAIILLKKKNHFSTS